MANQGDDFIPLISGATAGPLGVVHLPRLWLKLLLHALGRLPDGYRHGVGGSDEAVMTSLGINADAFIAFIEKERPDYIACEAWVKAHGANVTPAGIAAANKAVLEGMMPDPRKSEWQKRFGVDFAEGWKLNQLDDWAAIHEQLIGPRD
jgi:hypothetical protein